MRTALLRQLGDEPTTGVHGAVSQNA
jgi:hypothetical protein